ncbi:hypothetical protein BVY03_01355, partial [bacterium K02(2017)]
MFPIPVLLLLTISLLFFAYSAFYRTQVLLAAQGKSDRFNNIPKRILQVFEFAFGQKRLLFRDTKSGIMHALIFWGFCIISLRSITFFGLGFHDSFIIPGLNTFIGTIYNSTLNVFLILVLLA